MLYPSTTSTADVPLGKALQSAPTELLSRKLLYVYTGQLPGVNVKCRWKDAQSAHSHQCPLSVFK